MRLGILLLVGLLTFAHTSFAQAGWQTSFIGKTPYSGEPLPPKYIGKSVPELQALGYNKMSLPAMTPASFQWADSADADTLGDIPSTVSSELRGHPLLDKLIGELNQDPMALAAYVQNEIGLSNAVQAASDLADGYTLAADQIMRGALGTYLEKQGSPWEQCALLVHLMRRAGYPAAYVYSTYNSGNRGVWMFTRDLYAMLGVHLKEGVDGNSLVRVYFPWVAFYTTKTGTGGEWKQVFPWIKDTAIEEGLNHYDYLPSGYASGKDWMQKYLTNDASINNLIPEGGRDTPGQLFRCYVDANVAARGLSAEDFGIRKYNRKRQYSNWSDFPTPFIIGQYDLNTWTGTLSVKTNDLKDTADASKFATIQVSIQNATGGTNQIVTQAMRLCDLHNRRFYAFYKPGESKIALELSAFDEDAGLTAGTFSTTTVIARQYAEVANPGVPLQIKVDIEGLNSSVSFTGPEFTRPIDANSLTAICFNAGHVTQDMLDVHARKFKQMELLATAPPIQDYVGVTMFTAGMSFWSNMLPELEQIRDLHKIYTYFDYGVCLASITPGTGSSSGQWRIPRLDIPFKTNLLSNSSIHPYSTKTQAQIQQDDYFLEAGVASANEHYVLNSFFGKQHGISTVKLLRLANSRHAATAGNNGQGFFSFTRSQFEAANTDPTYATLRAEAGAGWTAAYNALKIGVASYVPSGWETVYVTPFDISMAVSGSATPAYNGMGVLFIAPSLVGALIDGQASGGVGESFTTDIFNTSNFGNLSLSFNLGGGYKLIDFSNLDFGLLVASVGNTDLTNYFSKISLGNLFVDSFTKTTWTVGFNQLGYGTSSDLGSVGSTVYSSGWLGKATWNNLGGLGNSFVSDPVNVISGEFYIDAVDLTLPGPFPLEIRRNYGSQCEALNLLGYGWKFSLTPYINITQDSSVIYAADPDGSVVAYRKVTGSNPERWDPTVADNPLLNNYNGGRIGGRDNPFNAYVLKTTETTNTIYTLYKPNGNNARYRVRSFPITSGGTSITRQRPYLERWSDAFGNYFTFTYFETSTDPEYGQLRRIESTNGSYLGFRYNATGQATEIFTHDGRRVSYRYDNYGDLVGVTLPDNAAITYEYKILTDAANGNAPYSTHLLITERKPDGRLIKNVYDPLYDPKNATYSDAKYRRVKEQWGTVGVDLVPLKFAEFNYNPVGDAWLTAGFDVTYVYSDVRASKGRLTTTYVHKNGLYYYIADAVASGFTPSNVSMDHVICNEWYGVGETNGYPRSVKSIKDKRGLITRYEYDTKGSLKKVTKEGDLIGDGTTATASTYFYYDSTRFLLKKVIEPLPASGMAQRVTHYTYPTIAGGANFSVDPGNSSYYLYAYLPQKVTNYAVLSPALNELEPSVGDKILEVVNSYGREVTTGLEAHGLLKKTSSTSPLNIADKTETSWQYSFRGYPTSRTQKTFTTTADVTTLFEYNLKGELTKETDPAGRMTAFEYDLMGRLKSKTRYASATALAAVDWKLNYFNQNGEVVWEDGTHAFPEDYIFRDYDGGGRVIAEVRWRSQAKTDGTGVEAAPNQTAFLGQSITYFEHDGFGNLVSKIDPRGNQSRMVYDELGQLSSLTVAVGTTDEAVESYLYEPGGLARSHMNPKGGETTTLYTDGGQPLQKNTPDGRVEQWRYYLDGRVKTHTLSNGAVSTCTYDDKLLKETHELTKGTTTFAKQIVTFDTRRNEVKREEFAAASTSYVFDTDYDGLNRVVRKAGPPAKTHPDTSETVSSQQVTTFTYTYGNASTPYTVESVTGTIKKVDVYNSTDQVGLSLAINTTSAKTEDEFVFTYADTVNEMITKRVFRDSNGVGSDTLVTEHYSDNNGNPVLTRFADGKFARKVYDKAGNLTSSFDELNLETKYTYDACNRVRTVTQPDNSVVTLSYDDGSNLTSRAMPGGIEWQAQYDTANRIVWEQLKGTDNSISRRVDYDYFTSGSEIGSLSQRRENSSQSDAITHAFSYDGALRVTGITSTSAGGSYPAVSLAREFDWRGTITSMTRGSPAQPGLIPSVRVSQKVDGYGQLFDQLTQTGSGLTPASFVVKTNDSHFVQWWNSMGQRTSLKKGSLVASKGTWAPWLVSSYFAGGQPKQTYKSGGTNIWALNYFYETNGLLGQYGLAVYGPTTPYYGKITNTFSVPYSNAQYDARGRLTARENIVLASGASTTALTEALPRAFDGKLLSYTSQHTTGAGGSWATLSEARTFGYDTQNRRLASENYKPNPAVSVSPMETLAYTFDADKLGVRTKVNNNTDNAVVWEIPTPSSGGLDVFKRAVSEKERSELFTFLARGTTVGPGKFTLSLGKGASPTTWENVSTVYPTPNYGAGTWAAPLTLTPGLYTLKTSASPVWSGSTYVTQQTSTFTVGATAQQRARTNVYDRSGRLMLRTWASGQVTQTFTWDATGQLVRVVQADSRTTGKEYPNYTWTATYDPLGRRVATSYVDENSTAFNPEKNIVKSWYDPQVEFLEVAVESGGKRWWKVYGPDLTSNYGSFQGVGGLELIVDEQTEAYYPIIDDAFGNAVAYIDMGVVNNANDDKIVWIETQVSGYGPLPGHQMRPLEQTRDILKSLAWQSRRVDPTGLFHMGARYYDPVAGAFISTDPLGHGECADLYSYAGGDSINQLDPTGRGAKAPMLDAYTINPVSSSGSLSGSFISGLNPLNPSGEAYETMAEYSARGGYVTPLINGSRDPMNALNLGMTVAPIGLAANGLGRMLMWAGGWAMLSNQHEVEGAALLLGAAAPLTRSALVTQPAARVGTSELGNALSGLGRNPLGRNINTLGEFGPRAGFSGVYDVASGKFLAYPSGATKLANGGTPVNVVNQLGGHADVNNALSQLVGSRSTNRLGFSMELDAAGNFKMGWNSTTVNVPNLSFDGRTVPLSMRQQVIDAITATTGRTAQ